MCALKCTFCWQQQLVFQDARSIYRCQTCCDVLESTVEQRHTYRCAVLWATLRWGSPQRRKAQFQPLMAGRNAADANCLNYSRTLMLGPRLCRGLLCRLSCLGVNHVRLNSVCVDSQRWTMANFVSVCGTASLLRRYRGIEAPKGPPSGLQARILMLLFT